MLSLAVPLLHPKLDEQFHNAEITFIGRDREIGYGTCGMPYVIGGLIDDERKVIGPSPEEFGEERDITHANPS